MTALALETAGLLQGSQRVANSSYELYKKQLRISERRAMMMKKCPRKFGILRTLGPQFFFFRPFLKGCCRSKNLSSIVHKHSVLRGRISGRRPLRRAAFNFYAGPEFSSHLFFLQTLKLRYKNERNKHNHMAPLVKTFSGIV